MPPEKDDPSAGEIRRFLRKGTRAWCVSSKVCRNITPCAELACPFKDGGARAAKAEELARCDMFEITDLGATWESAVRLFPNPGTEEPRAESREPSGDQTASGKGRK